MIFSALRLIKAGFVFTREGIFSLVDEKPLPKSARGMIKFLRLFEKSDKSKNFHHALTRLGPSYVKLGQFLATRPDLIGAKMALSLTQLQDNVPPFTQEEAIKIIEEAFEKPLHSIYENFSEPLAAASVAQVHKALYKGEEVAVKLLRPNIHDKFRKDLKDFKLAAKFFSLNKNAKRLRPFDVVETLERSVALEMDLRIEASALSEMRDLNKDETKFYVPNVTWQLTSKNVLTLEWINGVKLSDKQGIINSSFNKVDIAQTLMTSFLKNALYHGFFHADMHQGNLILANDGRITAIDYGIMGRLGHKERLFLAQILYGFIKKDYKRVAQVHFDAGYVPKRHSVDEFAQSLRAIGEPIHSMPASEISIAKLLGLLFDITAIFEMETRKELILLQKTMVVVEGVCRELDPNFNMWEAAAPTIELWLKERIGLKGKLEETKRGLETLISLMQEAPTVLENFKKLIESELKK